MTFPRFTHDRCAADAPIPYPDGYTLAVLAGVRTIALIGISAKEDRPSYHVMHFLQDHGFRVIPVNPGLAGQTVLGETVYATLADIPDPVEMIDIFRNAEAAAAVADEAIALNASRSGDSQIRVVWMQLGIRHDAAALRAEAAGLTVIMDRCPKIELERV
ncbi:CoA-binding protein [Novispirillum itersonii]|uniref:CoA-binding protein n=1 Tax=Novispirillum itersonii TaxID=189 RepID=UPI000371F047|nr:CoA-binding protein [Novispirillum itersonii]